MTLIDKSEIQNFPTILKVMDLMNSSLFKALVYSLPEWLLEYFLKYLIIKHLLPLFCPVMKGSNITSPWDAHN